MGIRALRILVAAAILGLLFSRIPLRSVLDTIVSAQHGWLLVAAAAAVATELAASRRLEGIVRSHGLEVTFGQAFSVNVAARLYVLALPAGNAAGLALRIHRLRGEETRYMSAVRSVLLDRVIAAGSLTAIGVAGWTVDRVGGTDPVVSAFFVLGLALLLFLGLQSLLLLRTVHPRWEPLLSRIERRWPPKLGPMRPDWEPSMRPFPLLARSWGWSLLGHGLGVVVLVCIAAGLGLDLSPVTLAWTRSAAFLVAILPISVAGLGVRDGAFVFLLGRYGVEGADALAFSLLAYVLMALTVALLGGAMEVRRAFR